MGDEFVAEIEGCLERAAASPEEIPIMYNGLRRVVARRFPYCVYFRETPSRVRVFAVFHASRDPWVWRNRSWDARDAAQAGIRSGQHGVARDALQRRQ